MRNIKFEYLVTYEDKQRTKTVLTLEEIEKGVMGFGTSLSAMANGVKEIHRRQYTERNDENDVEIYDGDILGHYIDEEWVALGIVTYANSDSIYSGGYFLADKDGYATDYASEDIGKPESWGSLMKLGDKYEDKDSAK